MKYGFYVSGNAGRLKSFLKDMFLIGDISFVLIDNMDNYDLENLCRQYNIPFHKYSYSNLGLRYKEQNAFISEKLLNLLDTTESEYCFVFGDRILAGDLLTKYENKLINFHPSVLPAFKGRNAIDQALEHNTLLLGNTAHFIDENLDAGSIIMQSLITTQEFDSYESVLDLQIPMLKQIIMWLKTKRLTVENNKVLIKDACYKINRFIPNLEI